VDISTRAEVFLLPCTNAPTKPSEMKKKQAERSDHPWVEIEKGYEKFLLTRD
jgi:hypothetical protein